jgi:hypothetical protein
MVGARTINVFTSVIDDSRSINYKNIMIVRMMSQLGTPLTNDSKSIIYDLNMFIIQTTDLSDICWFGQETATGPSLAHKC